MSMTATRPSPSAPVPLVAQPCTGVDQPCPRVEPAVRLRALRPDDVDLLAEFFEALSSESRRRRFFQATPRVSRSMVRYLCDVDQVDHLAHVAVVADHRDGESVVGEVRAVRHRGDPTTAEIAVAVRDDWQRRGVASALLDALYGSLAAAGIHRVTCEVLADNRGCVDLLRRRGITFGFRDGVLAGEGPVPAGLACV